MPPDILLLAKTLATLYPQTKDARAVVHDVGLDATAIAFDPRALINWLEILQNAQASLGVPELLLRCREDFPADPELKTAQTWNWNLPETQAQLAEQIQLLHLEWKGKLRKVLTLPQADWVLDRDPPSALIQAKYQTVPFLFREQELSSLHQWCHDPRNLAIRLYWGQGGMGKTRLMLEFCAQIKQQGWRAGFLDAVQAKALLEGGWEVLLIQDQPTLIVIDYAEGRIDELVPLLQEAYQRFGKLAHKVRLVLLSRSMGAWWDLLKSKASEVQLLLDGAATQTVALQAVANTLHERQQMFETSLEKLAQKLGQAPQNQAYWDLAKPYFERVLLVQMAALVCFGPYDPQFLGGPEGVLEGVLQTDNRHWRIRLLGASFAPDAIGKLIEAIECSFTLTTLGHQIENQAQALAFFRKQTILADLQNAQLLNLLALLNRAEGNKVYIPPLEPDLLGEYLVYRSTEDEKHNQNADFIVSETYGDSSTAVDAKQALTVVSRMVAWNPSAAQAIAGRIEGMLGQQRGPQLFEALIDIPSTVLLKLAVATGQIALKVATPAPGDKVSAEMYQNYARILGNYGAKLSEFGDRWGALEATQKAKDAYERLTKLDPEAFRPALASLWNNLGNMLSALGQREAALEASEEALKIYRELAKANPDGFLPFVAGSMNNLGKRLSALGQREEALRVTKEATIIYRELLSTNPDEFLLDMAESLNALSHRLSDMGYRAEALEAIQEALTIYRELAKTNPDAFRPVLATSLNNLGNVLRGLGRREAALEASQEALEIYRELVGTNSDAFSPFMAGTLNNLGIDLSNLGLREEALKVTEEAVGIRRELAGTNLDAFLPDVAMSLSNLGLRLSDLGHREEALRVTEEAVSIRRELANTNPDAFQPLLATSLNNLGKVLSDSGRREEALEVRLESVGIYRELYKYNPNAFSQDLVLGLGALGNTYEGLGNIVEACKTIEEGLRVIAPLVAQHPQAFEQLVRHMATQYLERCQKLDLEPDQQLLGMIVAALQGQTPQFSTQQIAQALPVAHKQYLENPGQVALEQLIGIFQMYIQQYQQEQPEPDMELLAPIIATLQEQGVLGQE